MIDFDAIIFDFDGVLIESEFEGNRHLAELLTSIGHPTTVAEAIEHYTGLAGRDFVRAVEERIGRELPAEFHQATRSLRDQSLEEGIAAVAGAIEFVRALPPATPRAVASSSSTRWVRTHLDHLVIGPFVLAKSLVGGAATATRVERPPPRWARSSRAASSR